MRKVELALDEVFKTGEKYCHGCGEGKPPEARKCNPCNNWELDYTKCNCETRVYDFITYLNAWEILPLTKHARGSATSLAAKIEELAVFPIDHYCNGRASCPLLKAIDTLIQRVKEAKSDWLSIDFE